MKRLRFVWAFRKVLKEKRSEELATLEAHWNKKFSYNGKTGTAADHIYNSLDTKPSVWENMYNWIVEHWDEILQIIKTIVPILLTILI